MGFPRHEAIIKKVAISQFAQEYYWCTVSEPCIKLSRRMDERLQRLGASKGKRMLHVVKLVAIDELTSTDTGKKARPV